jgi:conjugal transfer pilus assembly protein TraV
MTKFMADKTISTLLCLVTLSVAPGCSWLGIGQSSYSCPGGVDGVRCMSARQVYQATEASDYVKPANTPGEEDKSALAVSSANAIPKATRQIAVPSIEQPVPIRTQAKVMRIWMAPWEDDDGDLHADGYLYTEIESRRWNLGERFKSPGGALSPLNVAAPTSATSK